MKKIIILAFYFGNKPFYYPLWEKSVVNNSSVNFVLFTNFNDVTSKNNLTIVNTNLKKIQGLVQKHFDFEIKLDWPYKFADYRPAWGEIFREYIEGYDIWGYCDLDMILGDIQNLVEKNPDYDKYYENGHFTLYRNDSKVNGIFKDTNCNYPEYKYTEAYTTNEQLYFDEYRGILPKFIRLNKKIYRDYSKVFDVVPQNKCFVLKRDHKSYRVVIEYCDGKLFLVYRNNDILYKDELIYCHYQKRYFVNQYEKAEFLSNHFFLFSDRFANADNISDMDLIKELDKSVSKLFGEYAYRVKYFYKKIIKNKYGIRGMMRRRKHSKDSSVYINNLRKNNNC